MPVLNTDFYCACTTYTKYIPDGYIAAPDGKMAWLLDYVGYNRKNQPSWRVSMSTLSIVQNHYPERLGKAVNYKPPLLFEIFWKAIRPFVDPVTRDKLVFLNSKDDQGM